MNNHPDPNKITRKCDICFSEVDPSYKQSYFTKPQFNHSKRLLYRQVCLGMRFERKR